MLNFRNITAELDDIANQIQKTGNSRLAGQLDLISNSLDQRSKRAASAKRKADQAQGLSMPGAGGGGEDPPPGSGDADEAGHADSFEATQYHKVPVGPDSMSRYLNAPSPADILDRLDFAQAEGELNIQAGKKKAEKKKADADVDGGGDFDPGDPLDPYSTAGLPETGDEEIQPPNDVNQEGDDLEFFGNEPPGSLHMPVGRRQKAKLARSILLRTAADVVVDEPANLHQSEPGEDVERDQSLGGKGGGGEEVMDEEDVMEDYDEDMEDEGEDEVMDEGDLTDEDEYEDDAEMEDDYDEDMEDTYEEDDEEEEDDEDGDEEAGAYAGKEYASRKSSRSGGRTASRRPRRGQPRIKTTVR